MYSLVLMAALTTSSVEPGCWGRWCGCHGGYASSYGGCYGGCYGGSYGGCYGSYGACYGSYGCYGYSAGYSCYGGCYGGCVGGGWGITNYAPVLPPQIPSSLPVAPEQVPAPKKASLSNQAKLIVELPADAKLFIDNQLMKTAAGERVFRTPQLEKGQAYYYIVRAEVVREGKPQSMTKQVIVRAGDEARATFFEDMQAPTERIASAGKK